MSDSSHHFAEYRRKVDKLIEAYLNQQKELELRETEIANLRHDLRQAGEEISRLKEDNEFLKVSHRIAAGSDDLVSSRRLIAGLIRGIDRCIAELKE